jgi:hypothetical protein
MRAIMAHKIMASWPAGRCSWSRVVRRCLLIQAEGPLDDPAAGQAVTIFRQPGLDLCPVQLMVATARAVIAAHPPAPPGERAGARRLAGTAVATSPTVTVFGSPPAAMRRTTMSLLMVPLTSSLSPRTSSAPTPSLRIRCPAWRRVCPASMYAVSTSAVLPVLVTATPRCRYRGNMPRLASPRPPVAAPRPRGPAVIFPRAPVTTPPARKKFTNGTRRGRSPLASWCHPRGPLSRGWLAQAGQPAGAVTSRRP